LDYIETTGLCNIVISAKQELDIG